MVDGKARSSVTLACTGVAETVRRLAVGAGVCTWHSDLSADGLKEQLARRRLKTIFRKSLRDLRRTRSRLGASRALGGTSASTAGTKPDHTEGTGAVVEVGRVSLAAAGR